MDTAGVVEEILVSVRLLRRCRWPNIGAAVVQSIAAALQVGLIVALGMAWGGVRWISSIRRHLVVSDPE